MPAFANNDVGAAEAPTGWLITNSLFINYTPTAVQLWAKFRLAFLPNTWP
jgi:hypothetical protein